MLRWLCALVTGAVLSAFAFLLVTGEYTNDGPVVVALDAQRGLHAGDVVVVGAWLVAMVALAVLVWLSRVALPASSSVRLPARSEARAAGRGRRARSH